MPTITPCLPRGSGYRELTETASTKELDLSNHLSEVPARPKTQHEAESGRRTTHYRSKGVLKEKNFWLFIISMFVFLAMFVALRFLANRNPVHVRELLFQRTRFVHENKETYPLPDFPITKNWPGIVQITEHVIANLTVPGEITFMIFSPHSFYSFDDKTITLKAKALLAHNCSEDGNYGRAVVEVADNVFYLYYFTPSDHLNNLIQVDTGVKGYNRSTFFVPQEGHLTEAAFIGNDVFIRTYTRELTRRFTPYGQDYIELRSQKLRSINELLSFYGDVKLIVNDSDFYFLCRGTEREPLEFMLFIVKAGFNIRGFYVDRMNAVENELSLHFSETEVKILETNADDTVVMDYVIANKEMERELNAF